MSEKVSSEATKNWDPNCFVKSLQMRNGDNILVRPIRPEDEPMMILFHQSLSDQTVYLRYFHSLKLSHRISHERLTRICHIDFDNEMVLVVEHQIPSNEENEIIAVGRLNRLSDPGEAEVAVVVSDTYQGQGLGSALLQTLTEIAEKENIKRIVANVLSENKAFRHIFAKLSDDIHYEIEDGVIQASFRLEPDN